MIQQSILNTATLKGYFDNNEIPPSSDDLLDWRLRLVQLTIETNKAYEHVWYRNEIRAVDFLLKKYYT